MDGLDPQRAREAREARARRGKHRRHAGGDPAAEQPGPTGAPRPGASDPARPAGPGASGGPGTSRTGTAGRPGTPDQSLTAGPGTGTGPGPGTDGGGATGSGTGTPAGRAAGRRARSGAKPPSETTETTDTAFGGRGMGVTYKYFGAPDGATAARVPVTMRPEELGGDELGMGGMFTKIKPETVAAMVLTGIEGIPLHKVPPLELVVLHPDYAVVKLPMTVVDPLRGIGEESVGAAAFIWSTVPDRGGPRDAFNVYQLLHEWQQFSERLHENGHQPYCLVWP